MNKIKLKPEFESLAKFLEEFNSESDRGAALNAAAYLDESLNNILKSYLLENKSSIKLLEGFNAPLGTFSAKAAAAHSLGLIQNNEFDEITIIRKIRNEFAHSWNSISFETEKIKKLVNLLPWNGPTELEKNSTAKSRFNFAIGILIIDLIFRSKLVSKEKRSYKVWPNKIRN